MPHLFFSIIVTMPITQVSMHAKISSSIQTHGKHVSLTSICETFAKLDKFKMWKW